MFATIDAGLGSNTDYRNYAINFMRAVRTIATANAGTTPTCNVISGPSGTMESNQMITVISNTSAGGWTVDESNTSYNLIGNTYNSSGASGSYPYSLNLYTDTGKNQYPYHMFTIRTNPSYSFGSSFNSYPHLAFYTGVSNTAVWGSGSYGGNYSSGIGTTSSLLTDVNNSWSNPSYQSNPAYHTCFNVSHMTWGGSYTNSIGENANLFYVAATSDYIIILNRGCGMVYSGKRTTQGWEDSYDDNPPVVGFQFNRWMYPQSIFGWQRVMTVNGGTPSAANISFHKYVGWDSVHATSWSNNSYNAVDPISGSPIYYGYANQIAPMYTSPTAVRIKYPNITAPAGSGLYNSPNMLFHSINHSVGYYSYNIYGSYPSTYRAVHYAPAVDTSSGALTPPAVPIVYSIYGMSFNPGGRLKGIYKSLSGPTSYCSSVATNRQQVTVNESGTNTTYMNINMFIGVSQYGNTYTDSFLIKVA